MMKDFREVSLGDPLREEPDLWVSVMPKAKPKNGPLFDPTAFGRLIDAAVEKRNVTFLQAAVEIGINSSALHRIRVHGKPPSVETFLRISSWLKSVGAG
jgi:hypothetical protein